MSIFINILYTLIGACPTPVARFWLVKPNLSRRDLHRKEMLVEWMGQGRLAFIDRLVLFTTTPRNWSNF